MTAQHKAPCTDCGSASSLAETVTKSTQMLIQAHIAVAQVYSAIAQQTKAEDQQLFLDMESKHRKMAEDLRTVVVPEMKS